MKKLTSVLLVLLLALAACSGEGASAVTEAPPDSASETSSAPETTTTAEPGPVFEKRDLGGADFTVAAHYDETMLKAYGNEVYAEKENGELINDSVFQRNREVEELYNVKLKHQLIETGRASNPTALINSILAGEGKTQAILFSTRGLHFLVSGAAYVRNLAEIDTLDLSSPWWNQSCVEAYSIKGANYFVTGDLCYYETMNPMCFFFSKILAENLKLDDPYAIVRSGDWTIDNMYGMAKKASADLNGDGKMTVDEDRWGFMSQRDCLWYWNVASGITAVEKDVKTGLPALVLDTGRAATLAEKVMDIFTDANVTVIASYAKSTRYPSIFTMFQNYLCGGQGLFYYNTLSATNDFRALEGDFGVLPVPKLDAKQDGYSTMASTWYGTNVLIPVTYAKYDEAGLVLDALGWYSKKLVTPAVMEFTITNKALRDTDSEEMVELLVDGLRYDLENVYTFGASTVFYALADGKSKDFASQYAASEAKIKSTIETTVNEIVKQNLK